MFATSWAFFRGYSRRAVTASAAQTSLLGTISSVMSARTVNQASCEIMRAPSRDATRCDAKHCCLHEACPASRALLMDCALIGCEQCQRLTVLARTDARYAIRTQLRGSKRVTLEATPTQTELCPALLRAPRAARSRQPFVLFTVDHSRCERSGFCESTPGMHASLSNYTYDLKCARTKGAACRIAKKQQKKKKKKKHSGTEPYPSPGLRPLRRNGLEKGVPHQRRGPSAHHVQERVWGARAHNDDLQHHHAATLRPQTRSQVQQTTLRHVHN